MLNLVRSVPGGPPGVSPSVLDLFGDALHGSALAVTLRELLLSPAKLSQRCVSLPARLDEGRAKLIHPRRSGPRPAERHAKFPPELPVSVVSAMHTKKTSVGRRAPNVDDCVWPLADARRFKEPHHRSLDLRAKPLL